MRAIRQLLFVVLVLPVVALIVVLAVANREPVRLVFDPFNPQAPAIDFTMPLYLVILGGVVLGALAGGLAAWTGQGRYRAESRRLRSEVSRLDREADRLRRAAESPVMQTVPSNSRSVALRQVA